MVGLYPSDSDIFIDAADSLNILTKIIENKRGANYLSKVKRNFQNIHYSHNPMIAPKTEVEFDDPDLCELTFSMKLPSEPAYVMFPADERDSRLHKIVIIENAKCISDIMRNSRKDLDYFVSDAEATYLICRSWYVLQIAGSIACKFADDLKHS